ncbi:unnamed protein product, partial [Mycena citricolor]
MSTESSRPLGLSNPTTSNAMLFSVVSVALFLVPGIRASPYPDGQMEARQTACPAGQYRTNPTTCSPCPAGSFCNGSGNPEACDNGRYQPSTGQSSCIGTSPGYFVNTRGSSSQTPCPPGSYQPYSTQAFCYGAPSGRFQAQSGKAFVCGSCCGWSAPLTNNNVHPVKCKGSSPNSWPSSGDGCISAQTSCTRMAHCHQAADGSC